MKSKILILAGILALASCSSASHYNSDKQQRKMTPEKVNKRNKKNLKKWGLGTVEKWQEVQDA